MTQNEVVEKKGKWYVFSKDGGKQLGGPYDTEDAAKKRLGEIEHFAGNQFHSITSNLRSTAKLRHDSLEGRDYIVVPMVMLTEGVHNGSQGPLLYTPEDLSNSVSLWDHKPIVVYHPQGGTACDPTVLTNRKVGVVLHTQWDGRLKAEAWLEKDRLKKVDDRILHALEKGEVVEISTGLYTDNEREEGEWNGEKYVAIARNHKPDHLAILPDLKGACSVEDGAGLLRNELSHSSIGMKIAELLQKKMGTPGALAPWPGDVFDTFFVYSKDGKDWMQKYTVDGEVVSLDGTPQEVFRTVEYRAKDGTVVANHSTFDKEGTMDKKALVDKIVVNKSSGWEEGDREALMAMDAAVLKKIAASVTANQAKAPPDLTEAELAKWEKMSEDERVAWLKERKAPPTPPAKNDAGPVVEEEKPAGTVEEYIASAPEDMQDVLRSGLAAHNAERAKVISTITSNKANQFTPQELAGKRLDELKRIAALAQSTKPPVANYSGMADAGVVNSTEEPLVAPVMTFGK